ncbi:zf-C3HC4_3 domain-containing protein, partial [Cephalotus follicularis]
MDGLVRSSRWKNLKQRLGFNAISCCGATWSPRNPTLTIIEESHAEAVNVITNNVGQIPVHHSSTINHASQIQAASGTNLRMALAAERKNGGPSNVKTLMRLIEETDGVDWESRGFSGVEGGNDWVCCLCMERDKGAAFIPCGHTFCRVCSRELWVNRRSCPICTRSILQILDIF